MEISKANTQTSINIPLFLNVQAGFPGPAGEEQLSIDLNKHLIKHPSATFFVKVSGNSMTGKGIFEGDLAVVDRSLTAHSGNIIIAFINSEFTIKEFFKSKNTIILKSANKQYPHIYLKETDDFEIWGVVTNVIRKV